MKFLHYLEGKKKGQKFFKISHRLFVAQRRFVFYKILQHCKFFSAIFWGCSSASNADFSRVFRLSTPKKGPKKPQMTTKLKI